MPGIPSMPMRARARANYALKHRLVFVGTAEDFSVHLDQGVPDRSLAPVRSGGFGAGFGEGEPRRLWPYAVRSISDWKNDYLEICHSCSVRNACGGVFTTSGNRLSQYLRPLP